MSWKPPLTKSPVPGSISFWAPVQLYDVSAVGCGTLFSRGWQPLHLSSVHDCIRHWGWIFIFNSIRNRRSRTRKGQQTPKDDNQLINTPMKCHFGIRGVGIWNTANCCEKKKWNWLLRSSLWSCYNQKPDHSINGFIRETWRRLPVRFGPLYSVYRKI